MVYGTTVTNASDFFEQIGEEIGKYDELSWHKIFCQSNVGCHSCYIGTCMVPKMEYVIRVTKGNSSCEEEKNVILLRYTPRTTTSTVVIMSKHIIFRFVRLKSEQNRKVLPDAENKA